MVNFISPKIYYDDLLKQMYVKYIDQLEYGNFPWINEVTKPWTLYMQEPDERLYSFEEFRSFVLMDAEIQYFDTDLDNPDYDGEKETTWRKLFEIEDYKPFMDKYTVEQVNQMYDNYVKVCKSSAPYVPEITYSSMAIDKYDEDIYCQPHDLNSFVSMMNNDEQIIYHVFEIDIPPHEIKMSFREMFELKPE